MNKKTIWWIWLWLMWKSMASHFVDNWYEVFVYNRTHEKTIDLVKKWAFACESISEIVQKSDIIVSIVWDPNSVEEIYFWKNNIVDNCESWKIVIDMTTTKPSLSKQIYYTFKEKWVSFLDAPVSGGEIWAKNKNLAIMVWWNREVYESNLSFFEVMWKNITYCGQSGNWQQTKMANQISIAGNTISFCESLVYAEKMWLDLEKTIKVISSWAGSSWWWINLAPMVIENKLDTNFFIKHFIKDLKIVLEECDNMNICLPGLNLVYTLYKNLLSEWWENLWTHAFIKVIKKLNNID